MTQGPFYIDTLPPHVGSTTMPTAVTLTGTDQPIIPTALLPNLGKNFFGYPGKAVRVRVWGQLTTAATPGNFTFRWYFGDNTAGNGNSILTLVPTMTANWTNYSWWFEAMFRARVTDPPSGLKMYPSGLLFINSWGISLVPQTAPTTSAISSYVADPLYLSLQVSRSGSTVETIQVHDVLFESLN